MIRLTSIDNIISRARRSPYLQSIEQNCSKQQKCCIVFQKGNKKYIEQVDANGQYRIDTYIGRKLHRAVFSNIFNNGAECDLCTVIPNTPDSGTIIKNSWNNTKWARTICRY